MKQKLNILTITISVLVIFTSTGCKKCTCECTAYNTTNPEQGGHTSYTVKKRHKDELCTDKSTQPDMYGNYTTCVIK